MTLHRKIPVVRFQNIEIVLHFRMVSDISLNPGDIQPTSSTSNTEPSNFQSQPNDLIDFTEQPTQV